MTPQQPAALLRLPREYAALQPYLLVSQLLLNKFKTFHCFFSDPKRGLLQKASNPPGSKSPLKFDAYSLNHAAMVGLNEVAWLVDFEQELTRRGVFVNKGSAAFTHNAFFKSKQRARQSSDDSSIGIFGSQSLTERFSLSPS